MDFTFQAIVDYLLALSGAIPHETPGVYLLYEEDDCLIEKLCAGSDTLENVFITEDIRVDTPALYLLDDDKRFIFFVDTENVLRRSRYDADEEEWQAELEGEGDIIIPQGSKLSGYFTPEGQVVFFQNQSGLLQGIEIRDSNWELLSPVPAAEPLEGTRHLVLRTSDGDLYLFYIGRDRYIHYSVLSLETGEWHDNVLKSPVLDQAVVNFIVIAGEDMKFETYLLTADRLMEIDKQGELLDLGKVVAGVFTPNSGKECVIESLRLIKKGVKAISGKVLEAKKKRDQKN
ncbi:hypothetical protein TWF481_006631 [Arthrobotrys musiformis]|uniref:Fucose-specific lectin n=1 Tax=Arthrobotrys musiformis TaxID=47236 RepID=A0AAV9WEV7_9PEZI